MNRSTQLENFSVLGIEAPAPARHFFRFRYMKILHFQQVGSDMLGWARMYAKCSKSIFQDCCRIIHRHLSLRGSGVTTMWWRYNSWRDPIVCQCPRFLANRFFTTCPTDTGNQLFLPHNSRSVHFFFDVGWVIVGNVHVANDEAAKWTGTGIEPAWFTFVQHLRILKKP